MSKEVKIRTMKGFIRETEIILDDMRQRAEILNKHIPILEKDLEDKRAELKEVEDGS